MILTLATPQTNELAFYSQRKIIIYVYASIHTGDKDKSIKSNKYEYKIAENIKYNVRCAAFDHSQD